MKINVVNTEESVKLLTLGVGQVFHVAYEHSLFYINTDRVVGSSLRLVVDLETGKVREMDTHTEVCVASKAELNVEM